MRGGTENHLAAASKFCIVFSLLFTQSVFQPRKDVNITACKQCHVTSHLPQKNIFGDHKLISQLEKYTVERGILLNICTI